MLVVLDSGRSNHVMRYRNRFTSYKIEDGCRILPENKVGYEIVGIGTIHIWMHNGVERTL